MNELLKLQCGGAGVSLPTGTYDVVITGVEEAPVHPQYGPGIRWLLQVVSPGEHHGKTPSKIGSAKPTPKNWSGRLIGAALGRPVGVNEEIVLADVFNKVFVGVWTPGTAKDGKAITELSTVFPKAQQQQ